ncbi:MAG TPA: STAS domain-containing protein [Limnobacter sp.]|nr:STAS domain-containing protein [Limnobacter sp.]
MKNDLVWHEDIEQALEHDPTAVQECVVHLEDLTIGRCAELAETIRQNTAMGLSVLIDLRDCHEVDTAGLQLLVCIQNDPSVNLRVHWLAPSEAVVQKAARLGLGSWVNAGVVER